MTKEEFEKRYAERSNLSVDEARRLGITIKSCDCGCPGCPGWQAVTQ
jgi:hypothetical protein